MAFFAILAPLEISHFLIYSHIIYITAIHFLTSLSVKIEKTKVFIFAQEHIGVLYTKIQNSQRERKLCIKIKNFDIFEISTSKIMQNHLVQSRFLILRNLLYKMGHPNDNLPIVLYDTLLCSQNLILKTLKTLLCQTQQTLRPAHLIQQKCSFGLS